MPKMKLLQMINSAAWGGGDCIFTGHRYDVPALLSVMDVFVLPSATEGFPTSLLEAMAAGRAVVATRVGGVPELVDEGVNGVLVAPGDPDQLASAIIRLLKDDGLRRAMGERGRVKSEAYSVEEMVRKIDELYQELLARQGKCE